VVFGSGTTLEDPRVSCPATRCRAAHLQRRAASVAGTRFPDPHRHPFPASTKAAWPGEP